MNTSAEQNYVAAYRGNSTSLLRWHHLDEFWETLKQQSDDWFIYAVGEKPPENTPSKEHMIKHIEEIDVLLHKEHEEDYCGIVYTNNKETPPCIKIIDPNNLGVSCGFSENPPLPGWILSKIPPVELEAALKPPNNRRHWWNKIFD